MELEQSDNEWVTENGVILENDERFVGLLTSTESSAKFDIFCRGNFWKIFHQFFFLYSGVSERQETRN